MLAEEELRELAHQHCFFSCTSKRGVQDSSMSIRDSSSRKRKRIFSESNREASQRQSNKGSRLIHRQAADTGNSQPITIEELKGPRPEVVEPKKRPEAIQIEIPVVPLEVGQPIRVEIPVKPPPVIDEGRKQPYSPLELRAILNQMRPPMHTRKAGYQLSRR